MLRDGGAGLVIAERDGRYADGRCNE